MLATLDVIGLSWMCRSGDSVSAVVRPSIVYGKGMFNPSVGAWTYSSGFTFTETSAHRTTVICAEDELSEICKSHFFEDTSFRAPGPTPPCPFTSKAYSLTHTK